MVGGDQDCVVSAHLLNGHRIHVEVVVAATAHMREKRVVVVHLGTRAAQQLNHDQGRRFPEVVDVFLICDTENEDSRSVHRFLYVVEGFGGALNDEVRHAHVHLAGQFNELCAEVISLCLPREIERVNGDAMTAESGAGIERMKSEGLGFGGVDHLPNIDAHAHAELLQLIDQRDVYAAIDVFEEFRHLCDGGRRYGHDLLEYSGVEGSCDLGAEPVNAA